MNRFQELHDGLCPAGWPDWTNFYLLGSWLLLQPFENYFSSPNLGATFSTEKVAWWCWPELGSFGAICTQTHLVTLVPSRKVVQPVIIRVTRRAC
jgi:hypothetical protein